MNEDLEQHYLDVISQKNILLKQGKEEVSNLERKISKLHYRINQLYQEVTAEFMKSLDKEEELLFKCYCDYRDFSFISPFGYKEVDCESCKCLKCQNPQQYQSLMEKFDNFKKTNYLYTVLEKTKL